MSRRIITLGTWEGQPIEWLVLKEENSNMLCVSKKILFMYCFNDNESKGSAYETSDIRKYLNNEFFNTAFNEAEKKRIVNALLTDSNNAKDDVFLLSKSEIENLMTPEEATCGIWWYTRTASTNKTVYDHSSDSNTFAGYLTDEDGIRPAMYIREK